MTTKSFNIDDEVLNKLMVLYPGATFTNVMLDLIENKINSKVPNDDIKTLIFEFNKLKQAVKVFKEETEDRLTIIENNIQ
jgi:hypothetical protein